MHSHFSITFLLAAALTANGDHATAADCAVPGSHTSIQLAIDEQNCNTIELASQVYFEHLHITRDLVLSGPQEGGAIVRGQVSLNGGSTMVIFTDFRIESGCPSGTLRVVAGAHLSASGMAVSFGSALPCDPDLTFADGFEQ